MLASEVMALAAFHLNDRTQAVWTNTVLLPAVASAADQLAIEVELYEIPFIKRVSIEISVEAADTELDEYPTDFLEPISLYEKPSGSEDINYAQMGQVSFIPLDWVAVATRSIYAWRNGKIYVPAATQDETVKLDYFGSMTALTVAGSTVDIGRAKTYLAYKTASIAASGLGSNVTKGEELEVKASEALDHLIRILSKTNQNLGVRRQPYTRYSRSSIKS